MFPWQATIQDEHGNAVINPSVTVYLEDDVTLADIYDDQGLPLANPLIGSVEGFVQFWVNAGSYKVYGAHGGNVTDSWSLVFGERGYIYPSHAALQASYIPSQQDVVDFFSGDYILSLRRDVSGTAATTADGGTWSPVGMITPDHWGAIGDGVNNDAPAMRACFNWAAARSTSKSVETATLLGNRNYLHPGNENAITITGSLQIVGHGIEATRYTRYDFTGRSGFTGGRFDAIRNQTPGAVFKVSGISFEGDFGTPHVVDGVEYTVAYRYAGGNQYEGLLAGGTTTTIQLKDVEGVVKEPGAYDDHRIQFNHGSGRGTQRVLMNFDPDTLTAELGDGNGNIRPVIAGQSADNTSYVQIGRFDNGMCLLVGGLSFFEVKECYFSNMRNQVINHSNCKKVRIFDCVFDRCARGGISGRRNEDVLITRHIFRDCGDDIIFNAQALSGEGEAIHTVVSDILAIDCVGARFIGARKLQVSNYTIIRPMIHGITIGHNGGEQPVNQNNLQITGVQVIDPMNRNAVAYDLSGGLFAAIQVISTNSVTGSEFRVPGVVEQGEIVANDPALMIHTTTASTPPDYYQPTSWTKISGNSVVQTLRPGTQISDINGKGTFYFLGTLLSNGYIDSPLDSASISCPAILMLGPQHKLAITENDLQASGNTPSILFSGITLFRASETRAQDCKIDFDGALTDVVVGYNRLSGGTGGAQISHGDSNNNYRYSVLFVGNTIDVDPYFTHPLRSVDGDGAPNGKWETGAMWAIDTHRCVGISIEENRIKNVLSPWRGIAGGTTFRNNIIEARPSSTAVQGVYDPDNTGVGVIYADGYHWQLLDTDLDPLSSNYLDKTHSPLSSPTMPNSGYWIAGQRVSCSDPIGTGVSEYIRLTSGNGHAVDVDWYEVPLA